MVTSPSFVDQLVRITAAFADPDDARTYLKRWCTAPTRRRPSRMVKPPSDAS
jgi:hypothetical protein